MPGGSISRPTPHIDNCIAASRSLTETGAEPGERRGMRGGGRVQAYDIKRKRVVNIQRIENGTIIAYSLPGEDGVWYFPLIQDGKNVERYELISEQLTLF